RAVFGCAWGRAGKLAQCGEAADVVPAEVAGNDGHAALQRDRLRDGMVDGDLRQAGPDRLQRCLALRGVPGLPDGGEAGVELRVEPLEMRQEDVGTGDEHAGV